MKPERYTRPDGVTMVEVKPHQFVAEVSARELGLVHEHRRIDPRDVLAQREREDSIIDEPGLRGVT